MPQAATATISDETASEDTSSVEIEGGGKPDSQLFSVEGIMMLLVAIIFDTLGILCAFLIWVFGVGAVLGRVVSGAGLIVFTVWAALRGGESPGKEGRNEATAMAKKAFQKFLKKHWKKLSVEAFPVLGDIAPTFIMMWYSELK